MLPATINNQVERIERFQSLQAGYYWRATKPILHEGIDEGMVLLIESIRWVDDKPHTIILRPHPEKIGKSTYLEIPQEDGSVRRTYFSYGKHKFLVNDFLDAFEFEPDHQLIRELELQNVQNRITGIQNELLDAQRDPSLLNDVVEEGLRQWESEQNSNPTTSTESATEFEAESFPAVQSQGLITLGPGAVAEAINSGITTESIASLKQAANQQHQIATIKSKWIQGKTTEIAETIKAMTPFYEEQAAAELAKTEDIRTYVEKLMAGIQSLDLYVGKDVTIETIRSGDSAPRGEPLTIMQKKLMMDEELAVWADIDECFDFAKDSKFFEALCQHDSLLQQIFPTQRCVLVMATVRKNVDYGDPWTNVARNQENKMVFLLIRDGMNIYRIFSPVESHLGSARLFPSKDDQDKCFRGFDGSQIKFEDVAYTDKLTAHEKFALHYKRFLLLICGLDHRLNLFGDFYEGEQSLNFVSLAFQEKYLRFIHDGDGAGMLPVENRIPVQEWIAQKNSYLRSGSRVLCQWHSLMNPDNAPSAFRPYFKDEFEQSYQPGNEMDVAIAYRSNDATCVDIAVKGESRDWKDRTFNCKVTLKNDDENRVKRKLASASARESNELGYLCLDAVSPDDLHWYIHNRGARRDHVMYIRFFKAALKFVLQERETEQDTRNRMAQALLDGNLATPEEATAIVQNAVIAWRAANRGKALPVFTGTTPPAEWKSLLDQMYMLAGNGEKQISDVEQFIKDMGYEPLRLVLSGKAKLVIYAAPKQEECDDRIAPHCWTHKITLEIGKTSIREKSRSWAVLPKTTASETTIYEWPAADAWRDVSNSIFPSFEQKQRIFDTVMGFSETIAPFTKPMDPDTCCAAVTRWTKVQNKLLEQGKYVKHPALTVPFGIVYYPRAKELRYLCVGSTNPHALLFLNAPSEEFQKMIRQRFAGCYLHKNKASTLFNNHITSSELFSLMEVPVSLSRAEYDIFTREDCEVLFKKCPVDPSIDNWFSNWKSEASEYAKVWIPDNLKDSDGIVRFDEMLGVSIPDNYNPVYVFEFECKGKSAPKYKRWIDICTVGADPQANSPEWSRTGPIIMPSIEDARAHVERKNSPFSQVIAPTELPDTESPPECVERWYLVGR